MRGGKKKWGSRSGHSGSSKQREERSREGGASSGGFSEEREELDPAFPGRVFGRIWILQPASGMGGGFVSRRAGISAVRGLLGKHTATAPSASRASPDARLWLRSACLCLLPPRLHMYTRAAGGRVSGRRDVDPTLWTRDALHELSKRQRLAQL